jgi:hypothetical protein
VRGMTFLSRSDPIGVGTQTTVAAAHERALRHDCLNAPTARFAVASHERVSSNLQPVPNSSPRGFGSRLSTHRTRTKCERAEVMSPGGTGTTRVNKIVLKVSEMQTQLMMRAVALDRSGPLGDLPLIGALAILAGWRAAELVRGLGPSKNDRGNR